MSNIAEQVYEIAEVIKSENGDGTCLPIEVWRNASPGLRLDIVHTVPTSARNGRTPLEIGLEFIAEVISE